jgi:hypothetical protein
MVPDVHVHLLKYFHVCPERLLINFSSHLRAPELPHTPPGATGRGQPHIHVSTTISLAEFMFMKKGQQVPVAGFVGKGRFSLVNFLPKI